MTDLPPLPPSMTGTELIMYVNGLITRMNSAGAVDMPLIPLPSPWEDVRPAIDAIEDRLARWEQLTPEMADVLYAYQDGQDATDLAVSALVNDPTSTRSAIRSDTASQVSTEGTDTRTAVEAAIDARTGPALAWEVAAGTALGAPTHASVQSACTAAAASGTRAYAAGTYTTDQTLQVTSDADLSGLTINYTGTGTAVRVGVSTASTTHRSVSLPQVVYAAKQATGWNASIGVQLLNLYACRVTVPRVAGFGVGLNVRGSGVGGDRGCAYNTVDLGQLDNNKVNLRLDHDGTGFANQNTFIGGRLSHNSNEGSRVPGAAHIVLTRDAGATNNPPNNNVFLNTSIESPGTVEYSLDVVGFANVWVAPRFERWNGPPWVRWGATATRNLIIGGVDVHTVVETHVDITARNNSIIGTSSQRFMSTDPPGMVLQNDGSSTNAALTIMAPAGVQSGQSPTTQYVGRMTGAGVWQAGRATEPHDRVILHGQLGRLLLGTGNVAPVAGFEGINTTLFVTGDTTTLGFTGANTDIGLPTAYRPRDVNASRYVRVGSIMLRDNGGTLEASSNAGTTWRAVTLAP